MHLSFQYLHLLELYTLLQALEEVQSELDALSTGCSAINAALAADRLSTADLLSESDKLKRELATSQKRSTLVQSFFQQYQLSAAEIAALQVLCCSLLLIALAAACRCTHYTDVSEKDTGAVACLHVSVVFDCLLLG